MTDIRAFVAIELPPEVRAGLEGVIRQFKAQAVQGVRWVAAENIHLTLKFLGDTPPARLEQFTRLLQAESGNHLTFTVEVSGVGAFPNPRRPRVIWVGLQAPPALASLQHAVERAAVQIGIPREERGFSPHLTLGRVRNEASAADLQRIGAVLETIKADVPGSFNVAQFALFRSDLRPQGSLYTALSRFDLQPQER